MSAGRKPAPHRQSEEEIRESDSHKRPRPALKLGARKRRSRVIEHPAEIDATAIDAILDKRVARDGSHHYFLRLKRDASDDTEEDEDEFAADYGWVDAESLRAFGDLVQEFEHRHSIDSTTPYSRVRIETIETHTSTDSDSDTGSDSHYHYIHSHESSVTIEEVAGDTAIDSIVCDALTEPIIDEDTDELFFPLVSHSDDDDDDSAAAVLAAVLDA